jgi:hypothetical protein
LFFLHFTHLNRLSSTSLNTTSSLQTRAEQQAHINERLKNYSTTYLSETAQRECTPTSIDGSRRKLIDQKNYAHTSTPGRFWELQQTGMYISTYIYVYYHICVYVYSFIYVYIYVYIYIHMYIHICIYILI